MQYSLPSNQNQWKFYFWQKYQIMLLWQPFISKLKKCIQILKTIAKYNEMVICYDT